VATLASNALTIVDDVKELLGLASSDHSKDNLIIRKINQVSSQIENYCGRSFHRATYTEEVYTGTGTDQIILKNRPVESVTSLDARSSSLNEAGSENVDTELYFINSTAGVLNLNFRAIGHWGRYLVTYVAGYTTIPDDLAEAVAILAAHYVNDPDGSSAGVAEKQEGQRRVRYQNTNLNFDDLLNQLGVDGIINSYANFPIMTDRQ